MLPIYTRGAWELGAGAHPLYSMTALKFLAIERLICIDLSTAITKLFPIFLSFLD